MKITSVDVFVTVFIISICFMVGFYAYIISTSDIQPEDIKTDLPTANPMPMTIFVVALTIIIGLILRKKDKEIEEKEEEENGFTT